LDFEFLKLFGLRLDLDRVLKIQDWIRITKYDTPLISGGRLGKIQPLKVLSAARPKSGPLVARAISNTQRCCPFAIRSLQK